MTSDSVDKATAQRALERLEQTRQKIERLVESFRAELDEAERGGPAHRQFEAAMERARQDLEQANAEISAQLEASRIALEGERERGDD